MPVDLPLLIPDPDPNQRVQIQDTDLALDLPARFICNTLDEVYASLGVTVAGQRRDFDVIVVGGGTFGAVMATQLLLHDPTQSRRILVLEAGPFVLPEHVQNTPQLGVPGMRVPWDNHPALNYAGLLFAIGGRSLSWGGWSPELLDPELADYPPTVVTELKNRYFQEASAHIGVDETNDFIYGPLHIALRKQLHSALDAAGAGVFTNLTFADLKDHPAVRYSTPAPSDAELRDWLGLLPTDTTNRADMLNLFKLEAPLAVQSVTESGLFPFNKFSSVPSLIRMARIASNAADGTGAVADARKRLFVVPKVRVQDIITETQADNWVRAVGVRVWDGKTSRDIFLAPPRGDGRQGAIVIALGTIESTRLALSTFKDSLAGRAASRMGKNLIAHLRSNLNMRIPKASIAANLPAGAVTHLEASALLVKAKKSIGGKDRYFHFQITASGLGKLGVESEAELFKKIPTLEHLETMLQADDTHVVITIRGIGEMTPMNPDSFITLSGNKQDFFRPQAEVHMGNSRWSGAGTPETEIDKLTWNAMDEASDQIALIFAGGKAFELLNKNRLIPIAAGATAADLKTKLPYDARRDDLGTTHHDAGTLWMGDNVAQSVTNEFGRIHDTTNCYVACPALFPSLGSPNPMLTGVALARRTANLLAASVLPNANVLGPSAAELAAGFEALFDGTAQSFNRWRKEGQDGIGFAHINGQLLSYGSGEFAILFYPAKTFTNFTLRLQCQIFDPAAHNSGVFVRFAHPRHDLSGPLAQRAFNEGVDHLGKPWWRPVFSGFEVQIDDNARGDQGKDFYGIRPEPDGLWKNRTGAIYKIQAGDRIWHLNTNEPQTQTYTPGPLLVPGDWFEYEIAVAGDLYTVKLTNLRTNASGQTTSFQNTDAERGKPGGFIGIQAYPDNPVAFRNIRVKG